MLSYLHHSEVIKVNTREFEHHVLAPNETDVIVMQARDEKHQRLFQVFSGQGAKEVLEEHQRMLIFLEQKCQEICQTVEQRSERQELLATLMGSQKSLQKDGREEFQVQIFQELKELEE